MSNFNFYSSFTFLLLITRFFWLKLNTRVIILKNFFRALNSEFQPILKKNFSTILFFTSSLLMIFMINFFSLFPYIFSPTSHISLAFILALLFWWGPQIYQTIFNINEVLAHLVPRGTPLLLIPLLVLIEFIRRNIRPLTLAIRLAANITAGHLILSLIRSYITVRLCLVAPLLIALAVLEIGVSFIQAYVFILLNCLYSQELEH